MYQKKYVHWALLKKTERGREREREREKQRKKKNLSNIEKKNNLGEKFIWKIASKYIYFTLMFPINNLFESFIFKFTSILIIVFFNEKT